VKATDLRGILNYVPKFRDKIFVINVDSIILKEEEFPNFFVDISVLRSLNIKIVLVHGASIHIQELGKQFGIVPSNTDGIGMTDEATLKLSILSSNQISHQILQGLADNDLRGAVTNAIIAHPYGIIGGVDQKWTGKVERVDVGFIEGLLNDGVIPVIPPLGFDGDGRTFRVNSDGVALEVAEALHAAKLIFLTTSNGVQRDGKWITQMSVAEADEHLRKFRADIPHDTASKLEHGIRACRNGVSRSHILDGREDEALLNEIFSNDGIGTMIYANEYTAIRRAMKKDVRSIMGLIRESVANAELARRTRQDIVQNINDYYVFEMDRNIVGCVALQILQQEPKVAEMGCLFVSDTHENQGIGRKLMLFAENRARELGIRKLFALSTQAFNYLQNKGGFREAAPSDLPAQRRHAYDQSGRNSKILCKDL
jgi:amino-acid N-acetyltransferase